MNSWYKGIEIPDNDDERVAALVAYDILDSGAEIEYDDITELAASITGCKVAYITFFDEKRSWMKSKYGLPKNRPDRPRELSLCSPTICQSDLLIVPDLSKNPRYANLPAVKNPPHAKFYCAMPLINPDGHALGTLCVWDPETKELGPEQQQCMRRLARQVLAKLETRRSVIELQEQQQVLMENFDAADSALQRNEGLLRNLFPASIADQIIAGEPVKPRFFGAATVLFIDFADFSKIAETFDPRDLIEQLDEYFSMFDQITDRFGLEKIKTVGDAYLAVAGMPQEMADHAHRACAMALHICNTMEKINAQRRKLALLEWRIRIGIHSGHVIAGTVGQKRVTYDVWGDGVNVAKRIQENCEPGRINVSEATYGLVSKWYQSEARGSIEAKHKGPVKMYYLVESVD